MSCVRGWNSGAFFLGVPWAFAHRLWGLGAVLILSLCIPMVSVGVLVYMGCKGNELAWRNRPFRSLEAFRATQDAWARWGLIVWGTFLAVTAGSWITQVIYYGRLP
ncbi:MAG: hypothetical protein JSV65_19325 [Armatimonadota bacterium]|nr:MAG: hypothetical protein JSV65_19325 [Armatimonadota bacterium]